MCQHADAVPPLSWGSHHVAKPVCFSADCANGDEVGGTWYWLRSPEDERRVIIGLYNRYCIRCHGVDGRGVWDIPDVPDFTSAGWQACRSDGQLTRAILEGRGACMPPFRGTLTLEEACAMARYLRTFIPGTEASRAPPADLGTSKPAADLPVPKKLEPPPK
jgi:mono/diheme cytochrome c family protein